MKQVCLLAEVKSTFFHHFISEEVLSQFGFQSISPYGSEWYINDQPALRNLTKFAMASNETFSRAVFLHSAPIVKANNAMKRTQVNEVFGEIKLEETKLPRNVPRQVCKSLYHTFGKLKSFYF